jgi:hypothetical protein
VCDRRAGTRKGEREHPCVGEQVQDGRGLATLRQPVAEPRHEVGVLRKQADLAGGCRAQLESKVADRRRPAGARRVQSRAPPAGVALEAEAGVLPPLRRASRTIGCRIGSIDDQLAEPLQTAPVTASMSS